MMPARKQQEDNVDSWLMSYADMITLLLCFFIIFVSVSEPKKEKLDAVTRGMQNKFGGAVDMSTPFEGIFRSMQNIAESHQVLKDFAVEKTETSVATELSAGAFFQPDSAEFIKERLPILTELATSIKSINFLEYHIMVEGYTSDVPVKSSIYPTNWELSSARADRMVRFFIEQGIEAKRLRAVGLADTEPKVPNLDANGNAIPENREKNQRLVIKIERVL